MIILYSWYLISFCYFFRRKNAILRMLTSLLLINAIYSYKKWIHAKFVFLINAFNSYSWYLISFCYFFRREVAILRMLTSLLLFNAIYTYKKWIHANFVLLINAFNSYYWYLISLCYFFRRKVVMLCTLTTLWLVNAINSYKK